MQQQYYPNDSVMVNIGTTYFKDGQYTTTISEYNEEGLKTEETQQNYLPGGMESSLVYDHIMYEYEMEKGKMKSIQVKAANHYTTYYNHTIELIFTFY